jgi:uncharacterized FAD-dependent dehydrogenase
MRIRLGIVCLACAWPAAAGAAVLHVWTNSPAPAAPYDDWTTAARALQTAVDAAVPGDLSFVLPPRHLTSIVEALKAFDHLAPGLYSKNTLLYGVEVKFYSSKVLVNNDFMTAIGGLYAIGDGAGITRGLMQASVTGIADARDIAGKMEA